MARPGPSGDRVSTHRVTGVKASRGDGGRDPRRSAGPPGGRDGGDRGRASRGGSRRSRRPPRQRPSGAAPPLSLSSAWRDETETRAGMAASMSSTVSSPRGSRTSCPGRRGTLGPTLPEPPCVPPVGPCAGALRLSRAPARDPGSRRLASPDRTADSGLSAARPGCSRRRRALLFEPAPVCRGAVRASRLAPACRVRPPPAGLPAGSWRPAGAWSRPAGPGPAVRPAGAPRPEPAGLARPPP